jgi:hypothetical protein
MRMTQSSDTSDTPAKPDDYDGLRAELATLVDDFSSLINELWPRLEDHKYRWELHSFGLPDGYDKLVVSDIISRRSNCQYLWIKIAYAAKRTFLSDRE